MAASGYYHKYNVLKYRIFGALLRFEEPATAQEIAKILGVDRKRVTDALYHWHKEGYGYTQRMKRKAEGSKAYRYKITEKGKEAFEGYANRTSNLLNLNKRKKYQRMTSHLDYFGINRYGVEIGITKENFMEKAWGVKPAKSLEPEPQKAELGNNGH